MSCYFATVFLAIKSDEPVEIFHYLNRVQFLQLVHDCDNEKRTVRR